MTAADAKLNVSIVAYRIDLDELRTVVDCLKTNVVGRIFLVDNASEKRVEDEAQHLGLEYIPSANIGYGAAHNIAIRRSLEDPGVQYHLVINSDLVFRPSDLEAMLKFMADNPNVGALHPRIVGPDGEDQYTVRMLPTPFDLILRRFLPSWMCRKRRDKYLLKHLDHNEMHDVQYMQGSFMLMRCDALRQVGLFDERFFMYPEDIDLSRRLSQQWRCVYWPGAKVTHMHRAASYKSMKMLWIHIVNICRYFNKWGWR